MWTMRSLPEGFRKAGTLDLKNDRRLRAVSFAMRFFTLLVFVPLFAGVAMVIHPTIGTDPVVLWQLGEGGGSGLATYLLLAITIGAVLLLHELVHLLAFRLIGAGDSRLDLNGPLIYAGAQGWYSRRIAMMINAAAPFLVISTVGVVIFPFVSPQRFAWVYLPVVVNAAVSAPDFMAIAWMLLIPRGSLISDDGETLTAYVPVLTDPETVQ